MNSKSQELVEVIKSNYRRKANDRLMEQIRKSLKINQPQKALDISQIVITEISRQKKAQAATQQTTSLDVRAIDPQYQVLLNDDTVYNPFVADIQLVALANQKIKGLKTEYEKAKEIYEWMEKNISYGNPEVVKRKGYSNSRETLRNKSGICAETTFLYVTMARSAGLIAKVADVAKDSKGERVEHACAAVFVDGRWVLVDAAYHTFDIKHQEFRLMTDREIVRHYNASKSNFLERFLVLY